MYIFIGSQNHNYAHLSTWLCRQITLRQTGSLLICWIMQSIWHYFLLINLALAALTVV
jgi:hypothetical protein